MAPATPTEPQRVKVVLFDGVCNLCNGFVNWVIDRDPEGRCRFVALQTPAGRAVAERAGINADDLETVVVVRDGRALVRSSAVLEIGREIRTPVAWLAGLARVLPAFVRDLGYRAVARSRYAVFGRRDSCRVPTPELLGRFLDPNDARSALGAAGFSVDATGG